MNYRQTILVVDDDAFIRRPLEFILRQEGFDTVTADGGSACMEQLAAVRPDLIIMDVMMPRVDGISLCRSIRDNPDTANIKVLAITAFPEQDNVKKMYDAGADLCLIKPLQFEHFRLEVIRLLNERTPAASAGH